MYNSTDEDYSNMDYNSTDYHQRSTDYYHSSTDYYTNEDDMDDSCYKFVISQYNVVGASLLVIFVLSVLANGLLMYIVVRFEDTRKVSNLFFLCLASFNLLSTITLPFLAVEFLYHYNWMFGEAACKIIKGAFFTGQSGSLLLLTAMTLDRFCTVVLKGRPLTQPGRRLLCAQVVCVATWLISIAASIRVLVLTETEFDEVDDEYYCSFEPYEELEERLGYYMQVVFLFLIPLVIIVFCYSCILRKVLSVPHMRGRRRALVLLFCHIVTFVVCFVPYSFLETYGRQFDFEVDCETTYIFAVYFVSYLLARSYCVVNPVFFLLRPSVRTTVYQHVYCLKPASHLRTSNSSNNTAHTNVQTST